MHIKKTLTIFLILSVAFLSVGQNIALQKTVTVSSVENNSLNGDLAVDGNTSTRWGSGYSDPQTLTVDLNAVYAVNRVVIKWEASYATHYQIQLSTDEQQWITVANITNGNGNTDEFNFGAQNARYVRMYGTQRTTIGNAQYGYSIYEFEVYGEAAADDASLTSIVVNETDLASFSSDQYSYEYTLQPGNTAIPSVTATPTNTNATYTITNTQTIPGTTTITVTSADGTKTKTYSIAFKQSAYSLVWSDEFDYAGAVDANKWFHQTYPPNNGSWFNNEEQHYTNQLSNSSVDNGTLKITAIKESYEDPSTGSTKQYTSARLNSKYAFKYGRVEVRAKLPPAQGTWPAIWTLGKNISETGAYWQTQGYGDTSWPFCGEIDIMEQDTNKSKTSGAFHFPDTSGNHTYTYDTIDVSDTGNTWHVYAMEWTAESINLMVDDVVFHSLNNSQNPYFDNEHFILLNIAMGGGLGGTIPTSFTSSIMEIDYVRVYQIQPLALDTLEKSTINLYPNPAQDMLLIAAPDVDNIHVQAYDLQGKLLLKRKVNNSLIDVSSLNTGVYLFELRLDDTLVVKKVIIN